MKIVYMGTPDIAGVILKDLIGSKHEVIAAVSQPDKPKGRGGKVSYTPVKEIALKAGIPVYQPEKAKGDDFFEILKTLSFDIIVVVAYGKILPKRILDLPKHGCINVHASLLPKYRGAAPIQWSVINGEEKTGITIQHMAEGIDTGDMILKRELTLDKKETAGSLYDKLAVLGGQSLLEALTLIEEGRAVRQAQKEEEATYASMLTKELGKVDFTKSALSIERLIRGLNPWPCCYCQLDGKTLKLWDGDVLIEDYKGEPGEVVDIKKDAILIKTGEGTLAVKELQLEGKKRMDAESFLRGYPLKIGAKLQ